MRELLRRYRAGASVPGLASELGVPFDWVAQRVIAAGVRRDPSTPRTRRPPPAELASDDWLAEQLAGGAGVTSISRRLGVSRSTVRRALHRYAANRSPDDDADAGPSDPEQRFAVATARAERASRELDRARRMQSSAVIELQQTGLPIAAIADRLDADESFVESLIAAEPDDH